MQALDDSMQSITADQIQRFKTERGRQEQAKIHQYSDNSLKSRDVPKLYGGYDPDRPRRLTKAEKKALKRARDRTPKKQASADAANQALDSLESRYS